MFYSLNGDDACIILGIWKLINMKVVENLEITRSWISQVSKSEIGSIWFVYN